MFILYAIFTIANQTEGLFVSIHRQLQYYQNQCPQEFPLLKAPSHSTSRSRGSISICSKPGLQLGLLWNKATSHHHSSAICNLHNLQLMLIRVSTTTGIRRSHSPSQCHPQHPQQTLSIDPHSMTTRCCRCSLQLLLHQGTLLYQMKTRKTQ